MTADLPPENILTPAHDGLIGRHGTKFVTKFETSPQSDSKLLLLMTCAEKASGKGLGSGSRQTGDTALDNRLINTSDSRRFTGAKNICDAGLLAFIDPDPSLHDLTTEMSGHTDIRDETKSTGQIIAGQRNIP
ncbi:MAG: hypothetical protein QF412_13985, partial [Planctomycetota bacterium]|nr:hypothetical protein [Planctomycetota bacterium]